MKIGDKVRVVSGSEEGRVISFKHHNIVEIEIEDGFTIPVLVSDLVVVSKEESEYFGSDIPSSSKTPEKVVLPPKTNIQDEIFLCFIPINENDLTVNLYNYSEKDFLFNVSEMKGVTVKSLSSGSLSYGKSAFITYVKIDAFEQWPEFFIQIIPINKNAGPIIPVREVSIKLKAKSFFSSKRNIPDSEKEGYLIGLRKEVKIEANKIKESFFEQKEENKDIRFKPHQGDDRTIDLHIESIRDDHHTLPKEEILGIQVKTFEQHLDKAISDGANSIKFIHGIGNGSLRHTIHKALSHADHIKYFEDSEKGKFGYGATTVYF